MKIDIIVPIYNNEKDIKDFYVELKDLFKDIKHNIIFVDNASVDNTPNILKELYKNDDDHIKVITLSKSFNKESAILAGLKYSKSDLVGTIDVNNSPKYIQKLYDFIKENKEYDCACICNKNNKRSLIRKLSIKYTSRCTGINNIDEHTNIKIMRRNMVSSIIELSSIKGYSNAIYDTVGFNIYYDYNYTGKTVKDSLCDYVFNYSTKPLKSLIYFGEFILLLSIVYFVYSIIKTFDKVSLLTFLLLFFSGLIICLLGVIGNYIAKTVKRNCSSSMCFIKNKLGFDENYL